MTGNNSNSVEKPLNGGERVLLIFGVGAVMLSFYVLSVFAILLLLVLIACELLIFLVLARFLASRLMVPFLRKHIGVGGLIVKSFRLRKGVEFRIPLRREDAPSLHEMLGQLCQRLKLTFPHEVVLQMGDGAWVNLKGMRSGAGKMTLGVGYDLLAGLSVAEIEAVLAHEMTHAKLIRRGFRNWLMAGQARIRMLANALWAEVCLARRAKTDSHVAHSLFVIVDRLLRSSTRLVAAYSRQDEFEADRGAADLCGSAVMKSALSKLNSLHLISSRLPWNERVAQLQQTKGYSQWLLHEIAQSIAIPSDDSNETLYNKYSTHPLIRDRLAALPPDEKLFVANSPSGIQLLAHPDEIAVKLVTELQQLMAEQEKKDSKTLEKLSRKTSLNTYLPPWQGFGIFLVLASVIYALIGFSSKEMAGVVIPSGLVAIIGVIAFRLGRYRDQVELMVPSYEKLVHPSKVKFANEQIKEMQNAIDAEFAKRFVQERKSSKTILLAKESYVALEVCDYLRAHVAARACLKIDNKSVEGALALAVACASFGQISDTARLLTFVQTKTGFKTFSTAWGAAWAALLVGDWGRAEAMLEQALKSRPKQPTLLYLLAIAQSRRGKLQSSIINGRRACETDPSSTEKIKFLIGRLLDGGYIHEAQERIEQVKANLESDADLMLSMAQLHLLQHNSIDATQWTERIKQFGATSQMLVCMGKIHETARLKDQAAKFYQEALSADHFPEAHLGLGRLETERNNKAVARQHILAALNVERPVGKEGVNTWQVLQTIFAQMLWLHEPIPNCRAWIASFPGNGQPAELAGKSFMVYAGDLPQAQEYFQTLLNAFQPAKPPMILPQNSWSMAPRPLQPDGPVRPGVQGIWY